jgi:vancomycin resistance protein YoaR
MPTRRQAALFAGKAWGLRLRRALRDALDPQRPRRHPFGASLADAPMLAEFESRLWTSEQGDAVFAAGKVQNLRAALPALHGAEVPAGGVFGFWKQLGRATRRRGYVVGRELREGCLVPSIGGGLCQLSNAIYDCAVRAGLIVVERHRHSQVLAGSLAEQDRDATVFWNYVDLRLRAGFAWRLEITMDAEQLRVRIRAHAPANAAVVPVSMRDRRVQGAPGDCHDCGQARCHRHVGPRQEGLRRLWWLSPGWPEFAAHLAAHREQDDAIFGAGAPLPQRHGWRRWYESAH